MKTKESSNNINIIKATSQMNVPDCTKCSSKNTFAKYTNTTSSINKEIICPDCGFKDFGFELQIDMIYEGCREFYKENKDKHVEIEYKNGEKEKVICLDGLKSSDSVDVPLDMCNLFQVVTFSDRTSLMVGVVKCIYMNKLKYYFLSDCCRPEEGNIISCIRYYCRPLINDETLNELKNDSVLLKKYAYCDYMSSAR